jgi:hypothetical protein
MYRLLVLTILLAGCSYTFNAESEFLPDDQLCTMSNQAYVVVKSRSDHDGTVKLLMKRSPFDDRKCNISPLVTQ